MIEAAEAACSFIAGCTRNDLDSDRMLVFAVVRATETRGVAAAKVSPETRHVASDIPWPPTVSIAVG
jgi:uncharacterized protein with HEPN domain